MTKKQMSDSIYELFIKHGEEFRKCTTIDEVKIICDLYLIEYDSLIKNMMYSGVPWDILFPYEC